ncbi:hypothetical protein I4U23_022243 [Adineta vaga]|nr:hypothetical protein I4U23_022243 [Adineta vaga]
MNNQLAVLLDSTNRHSLNQSNLGRRVRHFTDRNGCIQYVQNQIPNCRRIDLFLSFREGNLIGNELVLVQNVHFHIYYPTMDDIPSDSNIPCMWVKKFEEDELWVRIGYTIYRHDCTS